jgi:hypothetical protein
MKSILLLASAAALFATSALAGETIQTGAFRSIELRGGGHVTVHRGNAQRVVLNAGSTQYTSFRIEDGGSLVIEACGNASCPNGRYDLRVDIATPDLSGVAVDGGGQITGAADLPVHHLSAAVHGGGHIDMRAVQLSTADAAVEGGGHIQLSVNSSLHAAVNGGGLIEYSGHPRVSSAVNGGGDVRQGN